MKRLLGFLYRHSAFVVFALLELTSMALYFHRAQHRASVLHAVANINKFLSEVKRYPLLKKENETLLHEMAALREKHVGEKQAASPLAMAVPEQYVLIPARIINNSFVGTKNYLTLDKGALHGIAPGMGVVSPQGIVGKVKVVSEHFATVISLLHTSMQISAKISPSAVLGTVQWTGQDPFRARMLYVPRHVPIESGQAVVTSGYNDTFFADTLIGHIKHVKLKKEAPFYDIELKLSTDFSTLQHVCVVKHTLKQEKETLEQQTQNFYE